MRIVAVFICTLLSFSVLAQQPSREELERRRQRIIEAIRTTQQQLDETTKDKKATMGQLRALKNKLSERQRLINNINQEISQINNNIQSSAQEVEALRSRLDLLKNRYAQSVRYAYKSRSSYDMLAFIFSSDDFNEALRRMKYLKRIREYRKEQAEEIRTTQARIERKINDLNMQRSQKDVLLTVEEQQKQVLEKESNQTNKVVLALKGKEKELVQNINKNRKAANQLDKAVQEIIRREMEIARKKAEEERRKAEAERKRKEEEAKRLAASKPGTGIKANNNEGEMVVSPGNTAPPAKPAAEKPVATTTKPAPVLNLSMTPEAAALSSNFESNRGKLPWPVEKGFISDPFGRHKHPVAEKVMIENNGVDITTSTNAQARAVFEGTVSKVFYIPGMEWNVLVSHGRYFTLYSRLKDVTVKNGEQVRTKQNIGTVDANDEGTAVMNFQVWKDGNKMDPATWIAR